MQLSIEGREFVGLHQERAERISTIREIEGRDFDGASKAACRIPGSASPCGQRDQLVSSGHPRPCSVSPVLRVSGTFIIQEVVMREGQIPTSVTPVRNIHPPGHIHS